MGWWGSSSKDGTLFIDCMKPVVKLARALPGPAKAVGVFAVAGAGLVVGVYVVARKVFWAKKPS